MKKEKVIKEIIEKFGDVEIIKAMQSFIRRMIKRKAYFSNK